MSEMYNTQPAGLEKKLDELYGKSPVHLPKGGQKWLADNAWWIVLVGAVLSLLSILSSWQAITSFSAISSNLSGYGYYSTPFNAGYWWIMLLATAVETVLLFMAFQKLKEHKKDGWNLLFYVSLISIVAVLLAGMVSGAFVSMVFGAAIGALISWFFLFEIRSYFKA